MRKLPPPIAFCTPKVSCTRNSPSMTGIRQYRRPSRNLLDWKRSPKWRSRPPTATRSVAPGTPSKHAVVGQVSTACPTRSTRRCPRPAASNANSRTLTPGRPSGVSSGRRSASIPASTLHPITDVAKPVMDCAAVRAQLDDWAVITTRAARMSKASANVSTILTPRTWRSPSGGKRPPDENLSLARNRGVSRVPLIGPVPFVARDGESLRRQVLGVQTQERRVVGGGKRERRQERNRLQRDDRASVHPGAGSKLGSASQNDGPAFHLQTREVSHRP